MESEQGKHSVWVGDLKGFDHAVQLVFERHPNSDDTHLAFTDLLRVLNASDEPMNVLVDLTADPSFALSATLTGALNCQRHPRMGRWVVVGANHTARFIGRAVTSIGKNNIDWVETKAEALERIESLLISNE